MQWDIGTTEVGSSGAPLFDQDHRVIGILSGGDASCGNSVNDYFLRLTNAWDDYSSSVEQLKFWLDPENSGETFVNQRDPYSATGINNHSDIVVYSNPGNGLVSFIPNGFAFGTIRVQVYHPAGYVLQDLDLEFTGGRIDLDLTGMIKGMLI
ncbi:unnamed protein product [marine sediment metagenome]|uniref:Peptidase S1 domain-containing protein n=1 Tax=marine sediment metagenome TaxID=412755 RepID=X1NP90_9ZZZZ